MDIWLDDVRPAPEGWHWVTSVPEVIDFLLSGEVEALSLDNDLGPFLDEGQKVVSFMVEHEIWPELVCIHSANTIASVNMRSDLMTSGMYSRPTPIEFQVTIPADYHEKANIPPESSPWGMQIGQTVSFPALMFNRLTPKP